MSIALKPGTRLLCQGSSAELIVVKAPATEASITIGGYPPVLSTDARTNVELKDGHGGGSNMGKRYVDQSETIELLCTRAGAGVPAVDGELLVLKEAKALPSSD